MADGGSSYLDGLFYRAEAQSGSILPQRPITNFVSGFTITDVPGSNWTAISVDAAALTGTLVPVARTITATSPIQIDGTTSADLSANRTISILAASGSNTGSQSIAHYNLLAGATASPTASTLALRDGSAGCGFATVTATLDTVGATDAYGAYLVNTTVATAGNAKHSPAVQWRGQQYWTGGPASTRVDMIAKVRPVESANLGDAEFVIGYSSGGGAFTDLFVYGNNSGPYFNVPIPSSTFTQTYSAAAATVSAPSTASYAGIDNAQVGTVYATVADLNTLRTELVTAYQLINQLIDLLQTAGLSQ